MWIKFDILVLKVIWRLFAVLLFTWNGYRTKRTAIWDLMGTSGTYILCTFGIKII